MDYKSWISGFFYGVTGVIFGQPLDTIKTRMQAVSSMSARETGKAIFQAEGVAGLDTSFNRAASAIKYSVVKKEIP